MHHSRPATRFLRQLLPRISNPPFICSACLLKADRRPLSTQSSRALRTTVQLSRGWKSDTPSSLASDSAINAVREIPDPVKKLHHALRDLKDQAAAYVNLSRIELALHGLERQDTTIRVAALGLDHFVGVRRLVRVLLADPLRAEESWERRIEAQVQGNGALLLRHGESFSITSQTKSLVTMTIPSMVLKSQHLEILVSGISTSPSSVISSHDDVDPYEVILAPTVDIGAAGIGRVSAVSYPVHRALVVGNGMDGCFDFGRYMGRSAARKTMSKPLIKACFVLPGPAESRSGNNDGLQSSHAPVDIGLADAAITELRRSSSRSVLYEQLWFRSGAATALDWVLSRNVATEGAAHPAVKDLVRSLLEDTTVRLEKVEASRHRAHVSMSVSNERRQDLQRSLASWAERAHTELRMRLDLAFESERWRRISWWKLPFRVDDVEMIASGVLERYWLNEAEKEIIWMVGRMEEAGFFMDPDPKFPSTSDTGRSSFDALIASRRLGSAPPAPRMIDVAPERRESTTRFDRSEAGSWPFRILAVRMALRDGTVPNLQALAQSLLLQSLSSAAATTAFTALIYISYSGTTLYEAGAVAALGLSWTLRHLQKKWEAARSSWASEVQEVARKALKDTEDGLAGTLAKEGQVRESAEEHEQRFRAKVLLARASQELNNLS